MLFYETSGNFGEDDFLITGKELFLLDIGSASYTEYNTGDADLIKFMMENPEARRMKKGHIHSHNNMGVFFSSTDTSELADNCPFHNFYLSLIVNNKNEMCAKIAFRAMASSEVRTFINFKDQDGKDKVKEINSKSDRDYMYVHECEIHLPGEMETPFEERFSEVQKKSEKRFTKDFTESFNGRGDYAGYIEGGQGWKQSSLWEDLTDDETPQAASSRETMGYSKDYLNSFKGRKDHSAWEKSFHYEKNTRAKSKKYTGNDSRIFAMLSKLLALDFIYEGNLENIVKRLYDKFYMPNSEGEIPNKYAISPYLDDIERRSIDFYTDSFPEDRDLIFFDQIMERCANIMDLYMDDFPELASNLSEALNLTIQGDDSSRSDA